MAVSQELIDVIREGFALSLNGIHGAAHWERVRENGLRLAPLTGADAEVVELFAYLHDSKRHDNGFDPEHGQRAAEFVQMLNGSLFTLSDADLERLVYACVHHSQDITEGDITVQTCWDADRLDIGRIGVKPRARYLCTSAAKDPEMIEWAFQRSQEGRRG
jgi:uncharacterized protein